MPTKNQIEYIKKQNEEFSYNLATYGTALPNYIDIMVDKTSNATYYNQFTNYPQLDDPTKNTSVGTNVCTPVNICVPNIYVPDATLKLVNDVLVNGKPTDLDYITAEQLHEIAESLDKIPEASLRTSADFAVGNILYTNMLDITKLGYTKHKAQGLQDTKDINFADITTVTQNLVTKDDVPCKSETVYSIPTITDADWKDSKYQDLLKQLEDLLRDDIEPEENVLPISNDALTEKLVSGTGSFDWIAASLFHQLEHCRSQGLISGNDIANIYSQTLVQSLQIAATFVLEKDKAYWQNKLQRIELKKQNIAALLAKAEILMLPAKMELAYAQLEVQKQQIELVKYQVEVQKLQIPQMAATLDQTREQTALICIQKALATEELAQAGLDRKVKQGQIQATVQNIKSIMVDTQIKEHQANQAEIQTQLALLQVEQGKEDTKLKNAQWQLALKQIKAADVQILQLKADIKLKAQQLLKDKEQLLLIKAQAATAYAQVTATSEAIKASKAQYSDTIDGVPVGGLLGAQMAVNKMQAEAFDRDSFFKFASLVKDGWTAKKTADIAILSPSAFTAFGLDRVLNLYATKFFNAPNNLFELPVNYRDFMTDGELDGNTATPAPTNATIKP